MQAGAARAGSNPKIAAKPSRSRSYSKETNSRVQRAALLTLRSDAVTIVADHQVQLTGDAPQFDADMRCKSVTMDVGQRFLNNAKKRSLHFQRQLVELRVRPELDGEPSVLDISVKVLADGQAQSICLQSQRVHQKAERAQFLQCRLHGSFDLVAEDRRGAAWANFGSESHQIEAGSDKLLSRRVVQLLRDALALFLLKRYQTLRKRLRLLLQRLALSDVCNHANEP